MWVVTATINYLTSLNLRTHPDCKQVAITIHLPNLLCIETIKGLWWPTKVNINLQAREFPLKMWLIRGKAWKKWHPRLCYRRTLARSKWINNNSLPHSKLMEHRKVKADIWPSHPLYWVLVVMESPPTINKGMYRVYPPSSHSNTTWIDREDLKCLLAMSSLCYRRTLPRHLWGPPWGVLAQTKANPTSTRPMKAIVSTSTLPNLWWVEEAVLAIITPCIWVIRSMLVLIKLLILK